MRKVVGLMSVRILAAIYAALFVLVIILAALASLLVWPVCLALSGIARAARQGYSYL